MAMLTRGGFEKARAFIRSQARPIDQGLFAFHFESGSSLEVLRDLEKFQNADGGFGHGLEPDIRLSKSSPMATHWRSKFSGRSEFARTTRLCGAVSSI